MECKVVDTEFDDVTLFFLGVAIALTLLFVFIASRTETSKPLVLPLKIDLRLLFVRLPGVTLLLLGSPREPVM